MEYAEFGSVKDLINGKEIDDKRTISVLRQTLSALNHLHNLPEPVVHRDLKPGNMLVASLVPFVVKVADFGLAKLLREQHDSAMSNCGTSLYMAPEIGFMPRYTPAVDIWSLGVVILQLWSGFPGKQSPEFNTYNDRARWCGLLAKTAAKTASQPSSLEMDRLLARMLEGEPQRRLTAAECLRNANDMDEPDADGVSGSGWGPSRAASTVFSSSDFTNSGGQSSAAQTERGPAGSRPAAPEPAPTPPCDPRTYSARSSSRSGGTARQPYNPTASGWAPTPLCEPRTYSTGPALQSGGTARQTPSASASRWAPTPPAGRMYGEPEEPRTIPETIPVVSVAEPRRRDSEADNHADGGRSGAPRRSKRLRGLFSG